MVSQAPLGDFPQNPGSGYLSQCLSSPDPTASQQVIPYKLARIQIQTYIHTCVYIYTHTYMCIYIYISIYLCMYIYIDIHTYIHIYMYNYPPRPAQQPPGLASAQPQHAPRPEEPGCLQLPELAGFSRKGPQNRESLSLSLYCGSCSSCWRR